MASKAFVFNLSENYIVVNFVSLVLELENKVLFEGFVNKQNPGLPNKKQAEFLYHSA